MTNPEPTVPAFQDVRDMMNFVTRYIEMNNNQLTWDPADDEDEVRRVEILTEQGNHLRLTIEAI